jgi:hypothetical protein
VDRQPAGLGAQTGPQPLGHHGHRPDGLPDLGLPLAGPKDLVPATLGQFVVRTSMGAVVAWALLAPLVSTGRTPPTRSSAVR